VVSVSVTGSVGRRFKSNLLYVSCTVGIHFSLGVLVGSWLSVFVRVNC